MVGQPNWMTNQPAWTGCVWATPGSTYQEDFTGRPQRPYEEIRGRPGTATPPGTPAQTLTVTGQGEEDPGDKHRDENMREEVRSAVDEYISSMIAEKRLGGSTQATGITPQDLMVCGQKEGIKTSYDTATSMMKQFAKPGMRMLHKSMKPGSANGQARGMRSRSVPVPKTEPTWQQERSWTPQPPSYKKKEYHWSVWKTSPSPAPATPHPPSEPRSPGPPKEPIHDPWIPQTPDSFVRVQNPGVRFDSPLCETVSPIALKQPTPEPFKTPEPFVTPEIFRTPTVNGLTGEFDASRHKNPTPSEFDPDHRDNMATEQVEPMTENTNPNQMPGAPQFEPALKAWIINATPQERQVAYKMFKAMNGGVSASPDAVSRSTQQSSIRAQPKQQVTASYAYKPSNARLRVPAATQLQPYQEDKAVRDLAKSLEGLDTSNYLYKSKKQRYPVARHSVREPRRKDYTHENSFFMNACQPYRSHFIINPEWISENPNMKRNLKMMNSTKGPRGLRYSSK